MYTYNVYMINYIVEFILSRYPVTLLRVLLQKKFGNEKQLFVELCPLVTVTVTCTVAVH